MNTLARRITLPLKYLLLLLSYLFPRNKKIWCFGSSFGGNTKYLFIYMSEHCGNDYDCVWIGERSDVDYIRELGFKGFYRWSLKGLFYCLIGGVYVYNSYPANVNLYTMGRAKLVNLWHGVALKCIDRQIISGPTAKYYQEKGLLNDLRYLNFRKHADVVLSTSPLMSDNFSEAFDVPKCKIIEGCYPRCYLFDKNNDEVMSFIKKYEKPEVYKIIDFIQSFDYVYIYMPTWRDTGDDFLKECGFDLGRINGIMKKNSRLFVLKMHPDSKLKIDADYSNIMLLDNEIDVYPILYYTNCLITDFSSVYFDYLLMDDRQILLFVPDFEDYVNSNRSLKYPYDEVMKGQKVLDFDSLAILLDKPNPYFKIEGLQSIKNLFWDYQCSDMKDLIRAIEEKVS